MDNQGRVLLPDYILEMAKIDKEILLIGSLNKWELWSPPVFEQYIKECQYKEGRGAGKSAYVTVLCKKAENIQNKHERQGNAHFL